MFRLFIAIALIYGIHALYSMGHDEERATQVQYAAQRTESQDELLAQLRALDDPIVSALAADWRMTYPNPTAEQLSELREMAQIIGRDKSAALRMTRAYKKERSPFCNGQIQAAFSSSTPDCPPGL